MNCYSDYPKHYDDDDDVDVEGNGSDDGNMNDDKCSNSCNSSDSENDETTTVSPSASEDVGADPQYEIEMKEHSRCGVCGLGGRGDFFNSIISHQITSSSDPYRVIWTDRGHEGCWFRRRGVKGLMIVAALIVLTILVSIPLQKNRQKKNGGSTTTITSKAIPKGAATNTTDGSDNEKAHGNADANGTGNAGSILDEWELEDDDGIDVHVDDDFLGYSSGGGPNNITVSILAPLSTLDPVADLGLPGVDRPVQSQPSSHLDPLMRLSKNSRRQQQHQQQALPTNAWYQNVLLVKDGQPVTENIGAYTLPYLCDLAGGIPGLRVHNPFVDTSADQVIVSLGASDAVTLGSAPDFGTIDATVASTFDSPTTSTNFEYSVVAATDLGVTLHWPYGNMTSSLVRGMPYATMLYDNLSVDGGDTLPSIHSFKSATLSPLLMDGGSQTTDCSSTSQGIVFEVQSDVEIPFDNGLTWLVFLSDPVIMQCQQTPGGPFLLQVLRTQAPLNDRPLVVRLAADMVAKGSDDSLGSTVPLDESYKQLLRAHANVYPGHSTKVLYEMQNSDTSSLIFDWDPRPINGDNLNNSPSTELLVFAMPHHQDKLTTGVDGQDFCVRALLGSVCLVLGSSWILVEEMPFISFDAPRGIDPAMLPSLVDAVSQDLAYRVPENFLVGAGDTYFSGKAIAKLARILLITESVVETCREQRQQIAATRCDESALPTQMDVESALAHLREAVEVWLNGRAQTPMLYDNKWGGVVSCGCEYLNGRCQNVFPNCPGLTDQGLNFGAGFYNDHHFHYGYHIYGAAALAHFDNDWGRSYFEKVLLFVRDIANPSADDHFFPTTRHKDWFHGSSWASGISVPPSPTGMNQESSSEAIAGYEAVALFGKTMASIFSKDDDATNWGRARTAYQIGRLMTATELRSTKRYWHVSKADSSRALFDSTYNHNVVGILWSSKAFFGTWFGNAPYLIYGIQLLPFTAIAEDRDNIDWIREMFDSYAQSCNGPCVAEGWSVQLIALLATLGHREKALRHAKELTRDIFSSPGGNGHSLANTIWYIATRPDSSSEPFDLPRTYPWEQGPLQVTCLQPSRCTDTVLDSLAGEYSCGSRISFLVNQERMSEYDACYQIAVSEFPNSCGGCNPSEIGSNPYSPLLPTDGDLEDGVEDIISEALTSPASPFGLTCNRPSTCTVDVLRSPAGAFACGDRIIWLMTTKGMAEVDACAVIAVTEFPEVCGGCNPGGD